MLTVTHERIAAHEVLRARGTRAYTKRCSMQPGDRLGPYTLMDPLGKGGMAAVFRARQQSVDRDVALKVILQGIAGDAVSVQRFQREAKLIARLEHPHILPIYDFDAGHTPPYIVMRYIDGGTLKTEMARRRLPFNEIMHLLRQVCAAVDYAHRQGIIHRDIKPSNILIDREGNAFVADFGLARVAEGESRAGGRITETGLIMGTPDYMSPEMARSAEAADHRSDIYALGVMLFELLTGRLPFRAGSPMDMLMHHIRSAPAAARTIEPSLPAAIEPVLQRALAKDRAERFQSAAELAAAASAALEVGGSAFALSALVASPDSDTLAAPHTETDLTLAPGEQNKSIVALNCNAVAYGEVVGDQVGAEAASRAMSAFWAAAARIIEALGGVVFSRTDYELLALWGATTAREDDAEQAIRAALAIRASLMQLGAPFFSENEAPPLSIGIHRGLALVASASDRTGTFSASGLTIGLANRVMQNAEGLILVTHDVYSQVLGVFDFMEDEPLKVRGRADKITTYRVLAAKARAFRIAMRGIQGVETRMIGRDAELKTLQKAFHIAIEDQETQVVTIVSEAGIGKSRLLFEFEKWADLRPEAYYGFFGRATPAMTQRPFSLIRDMVMQRFQVLDDDPADVMLRKLEQGVAELIGHNDEAAHFIGYLIGFDMSRSPFVRGLATDASEAQRRARRAFISLITTLAAREAVMIELEDIHFADDASLDVLTELFNNEALYLLVLACARPLFYARRPTWGSGQRSHSRIDLKALDKRDSRDLAAEILQKAADTPKELRDLLVERAEGNPLYMEEAVRMLLDDRLIIQEGGGRWRVQPERLVSLNVPPTLTGLLEARLDTLLYPEKLTLQRASVQGRTFYDDALRAIDQADEAHIGDVAPVLAKLAERGFIYRRETSAFAGMSEYLFASPMLRDTLYERLLERQHRLYHASLAEWLIALERGDDFFPVIAEHFEKAEDRLQAARYLQRAGEAATRRAAYKAAVGFFERALALQTSEADSLARLPLLLAYAAARSRQGDVAGCIASAREGLSIARLHHDDEGTAAALQELGQAETNNGDYAQALTYLDEAMALAERLATPNPTLLGKVIYSRSTALHRLGRRDEAIVEIERCIALARRLNDDLLLARSLGWLAVLLNDPAHPRYGEVSAIQEQTLAKARKIGHRGLEQSTLGNIGVQAAVAGDWPTAIRYTEQALVLAREHGAGVSIVTVAGNLAEMLLFANQPEKAAPRIREAIGAAQRTGALGLLMWAISIAGPYRLSTGNLSAALRLMTFAQGHPASSFDTRSTMDLWLARARTDHGVTEAEIAAAAALSRGLEPADVAAEVLAFLPA